MRALSLSLPAFLIAKPLANISPVLQMHVLGPITVRIILLFLLATPVQVNPQP